MKVNARKILTLGLAFGLALVAIGSGVFWMHGRPDTTREIATTAPTRIDNLAKSVTLKDFEALKEEIEGLEKSRSNLELSSAKINGELKSLRSQVALIASKIDRIARGDFENSERKATYEEGADLELTPEEKIERAHAQVQARIDLLEETIKGEGMDPEWSSEAGFLLDRAYRSEEMKGVELVGVECKTTLCRLELHLNESGSPEEVFRNVAFLSPWPTQSFFQIDDGETGQAVIYMAREGHSLPQPSL